MDGCPPCRPFARGRAVLHRPQRQVPALEPRLLAADGVGHRGRPHAGGAGGGALPAQHQLGAHHAAGRDARVHRVRALDAGRAAPRQLQHQLLHRDDDDPGDRHLRRAARGGGDLCVPVRAVRQLLQQGGRRSALLRRGERDHRPHARRRGQGLRDRERPVRLGVGQPHRGRRHHRAAHHPDHGEAGRAPRRAPRRSRPPPRAAARCCRR